MMVVLKKNNQIFSYILHIIYYKICSKSTTYLPILHIIYHFMGSKTDLLMIFNEKPSSSAILTNPSLVLVDVREHD
jgi:hypothetical protein